MTTETAQDNDATTAPEGVKMKDGRTIIFGEKSKMKKEYGFDPATGLVFCRIDFANGETVEVHVDPASEIGRMALGHGLAQKLGDSASGAETTDDAFEAVLEVAKRTMEGKWTKAREGASASAKGASELVQALVKVLGQPIETVRTMLATLEASEKLALRKVPEIAAEIERIRAAKAPSKAEQEKVSKGASLLDALKGLTTGTPVEAAPL